MYMPRFEPTRPAHRGSRLSDICSLSLHLSWPDWFKVSVLPSTGTADVTRDDRDNSVGPFKAHLVSQGFSIGSPHDLAPRPQPPPEIQAP